MIKKLKKPIMNETKNFEDALVELLNMFSVDLSIYSTAVKVILIITLALVAIIGHILHTIAGHLFFTRKKLRTSGNFVNAMIFFSGIYLSAIVIPMKISQICNTSLQLDRTFNAVVGYFVSLYISTSVVGIELKALMTAFEIRKFRNKNSSIPKKKLFTLMGLLSIGCVFFPCMLAGIKKHHGQSAAGLVMAISMFISFWIVFISYRFILFQLHQSQKRLKSSNSNVRNKKASFKVKRTTDSILIAYIMSNILMFISGILIIYASYKPEFGIENKDIIADLTTAAVVVMSISIITNPLIYYYQQKDLRKEMYTLPPVQYIIQKMKKNIDESGSESPECSNTKKQVI